MKSLFPLLWFSTMLSCVENRPDRGSYEITGAIVDAPDTVTVYIQNSKFSDSTLAINGHFKFRGTTPYPMRVLFSAEKSNKKRSFWLENGGIRIRGKYDKIDKLKVVGGENQAMQNILDKKSKPVVDEIEAIAEIFINGTDDIPDKDSLLARNNELSNQLNNIKMRFIEEHPNALESVILLSSLKRTWSRSKVASLYSNLDGKIKESNYGMELARFLDLPENPEVGENYVDFESLTTEGKKISISQLLGELTLIDFWASWCVPCREENPNLVKLHDRYSKNGLKIISVSLDRDKQKWLTAIEKDSLTWDHLNDLKYPDGDAIFIYNISEIPDNILIDSEGKILARSLRGDTLVNTMKALFERED